MDDSRDDSTRVSVVILSMVILSMMILSMADMWLLRDDGVYVSDERRKGEESTGSASDVVHQIQPHLLTPQVA